MDHSLISCRHIENNVLIFC